MIEWSDAWERGDRTFVAAKKTSEDSFCEMRGRSERGDGARTDLSLPS